MSPSDPNKGGRQVGLGIRLLLGCLVALLVVGIWRHNRTPQPPVVAAEEQAGPLLSGHATPSTDFTPSAKPAGPPASALEEKWGIRVSSVTLTNSDSTLEVRYTVLAPEKTTLIAQDRPEVYLIEQATGKKLPMFSASPEQTAAAGVPPRTIRRMMRLAGDFPPAPSRLLSGRSYSLQIPNWDRTIPAGSTVSFVIGDVRADDLVVQ